MSQIEIYKGEDGQTQIDVKFEEDTVWLSQKQIAAVFGTEVPAINKHIKNIIREGELKKNSTISKMEIVQQEGKRKITRQVEIYNLDLIISVGYRVNSVRATQFRIWATQRLKDYLVNGLAVNKKRLEQLQPGGKHHSAIRKYGRAEYNRSQRASQMIKCRWVSAPWPYSQTGKI